MRGTSPEMRVILAEEFRRQIHRRSWQILTLLVPAALLIALVAVPVIRSMVSDDDEQPMLSRVGYVDNAGLIVDLGQSGQPKRYVSITSGVRGLNANEVDAVFVISADYVETGGVRWLRRDSGILSDDSLGALFIEFLMRELLAGQVAPDLVERVVSPANFAVFDVSETGAIMQEPPDAQQAGEFFVPFVFAVLLMIAIFSGSGSLLQSVADEKENRMIEMIITSATPLSIMAGKVFALGAAGLIQVLVWVASAAILGPLIIDQIPNAGTLDVGVDVLVTVLLLFLSGYFLFAVIMAGMGAATTSVREASQISALITIPAVIPVWFSALLVSQPDGPLARVLSLIPFTAPTTILIRLAAGNVSASEVAVSLVVIVLSGFALLWVSARVFRAGLLLYGQRMSLKNVWSALRHAD